MSWVALQRGKMWTKPMVRLPLFGVVCGRSLTCPGLVRAARSPKCSNTRPYFFQLQIRSADEPMTTFYKCVKCATNWNDGG